MKKLILVGLTLITLFTGCNLDSALAGCKETLLVQTEMQPYNGEALECHYFLNLREFNGRFYGEPGSRCADFPTPREIIDCKGKVICNDDTRLRCIEVSSVSTFIEIIGIVL